MADQIATEDVRAHLVGLAETLSLGAQGRGGSRFGKVSAESGHEERSVDDLGAAVESVSTKGKEKAINSGAILDIARIATYWKGGRESHRKKTNLKTK